MTEEEEIKERHHIDRLISWKHHLYWWTHLEGENIKILWRKPSNQRARLEAAAFLCNTKIIWKKLKSLKTVPGSKRRENNWWGISDGVMIDESVRWQRIRGREGERARRTLLLVEELERSYSLSRCSLWRRIMSHSGLTGKDNLSSDALF